MSDDAKDDKAPEVAGDGFTPAPTPPAVSPEEAAAAEAAEAAAKDGGDNSEVTFAGQMPDGSIPVPHDTAKRALEAVQVLVENNRSASQQLESLMTIVLDAAEVANRSASAVATTGSHVNKAAEKLIDGAQRTSMQAKVVLALAGTVLVGCAGVFSFMSVQLQNKVSQLDEMMLAVGKRAVDLKRRMESMDDIHQALEELKLAQENTQSVQEAIEAKIARLSEAPRAPARPEPKPAPAASPAPAAAAPAAKDPAAAEAAAKKAEAARAEHARAEAARAEAARAEAARAEAQNKALLQQLTALDGMLKDQARAVKDLSGQFNKLEGSVANVQSVKKDVEALAAQQKQREKEMAQELAAANARRDKELKDKERELARERERAREIRESKERELAREREQAAKDRQAAEASAKEKKDASITYNKDAAKQKTADVSGGVPTYKQPKAEQ